MSAFINRKPSATALLALIFGPVLIMLYLGKGRAAIAYLLLMLSVAISTPFWLQFSPMAITMEMAFILTVVVFHLAAAFHGIRESRKLKGKKPSVWFARWYAALGLAIILPNLVATLNRAFLWEPFSIPSGSSKPTLQVGDFVYVSKYAYGYSRHALPFSPDIFSGRLFFSPPERGDIAVYKEPRDNRTDYIKRIVGLPGDKIQMIEGLLHINGEAVVRTEIELASDETAGAGSSRAPKVKRYRERLPNGVEYEIYEVGDNLRFDNTRVFEVPEDHYFALGDNRDNSLDSRAIGPIPADNLLGRLAFILWNDREQRIRLWD